MSKIQINGKKVNKENKLHDLVTWDSKNIIFADPVSDSVPNAVPPVNFVRVGLLTLNQKDDGKGGLVNDTTMGDLLFLMDRSFSFGVQETLSQETKAVTGHSVSIALWEREGATERNILTVKKLEELIERCKNHLLTVKKEVKKPKLEMSDLKDMNKLLYWKTDADTGDRIPGQGPTLSPKIIEYKERKDEKTGKIKPHQIQTIFYLENEVDEHGNPLEVSPLDYLSTASEKKYMYLRPVVKFESIFIGAKVISIQCKITEGDISPIQMGAQRLLRNYHSIKVSDKLTFAATNSAINPLVATSTEETKEADTEGDKPTEIKVKKIKKKIIDEKDVTTVELK